MMATDYTSDTDYIGLHRRILETPADDAPRLILSDWLEENGQEERAKDIRHFVAHPNLYGHASIGNVFATDCRGFISEIRLTCAEFMGGTCEACDSRGVLYNTMPPDSCGCSECGGTDTTAGTGRIEGEARELFERHPITRVVLTDKKPSSMQLGGLIGFYGLQDHQYETTTQSREHDSIPNKIALHMTGSHNSVDSVNSWRWYSTGADALAALSDACVSYGRALAGLPMV